MSRTVAPRLSGVPETLLVPLCYRATESLGPDALLTGEVKPASSALSAFWVVSRRVAAERLSTTAAARTA